MPDEPTAEGDGQTTQAPAVQPQDAEVESKIRQARQREEKSRKKAAALRAERDDLRAKLAKQDEGQQAQEYEKVKERLKVADQREEKARRVLIRGAWSEAALAAGIRADRIEKAFSQIDFAALDVDMDAGTVEGLSAAAEAVLEELPEWGKADDVTETTRPGFETRAPGRKTGPQIDLKNLKPGDLTRLRTEHPDEYERLYQEGFSWPTGQMTTDADGRVVPDMMVVSGAPNRFVTQMEESRKRMLKRMEGRSGA